MEMQESDRLDMLLHNIDQQESEESSSSSSISEMDTGGPADQETVALGGAGRRGRGRGMGEGERERERERERQGESTRLGEVRWHYSSYNQWREQCMYN